VSLLSRNGRINLKSRMKYGKVLSTSILPEWAVFSVAYKDLKRLIKRVQAGEADDAAFWSSLEDDLRRLSTFELERRAAVLDLLQKWTSELTFLVRPTKWSFVPAEVPSHHAKPSPGMPRYRHATAGRKWPVHATGISEEPLAFVLARSNEPVCQHAA